MSLSILALAILSVAVRLLMRAGNRYVQHAACRHEALAIVERIAECPFYRGTGGYLLHYAYEVEGRRYIGSTDIELDEREAWREGDVLPVLYDHRNPDISRARRHVDRRRGSRAAHG